MRTERVAVAFVVALLGGCGGGGSGGPTNPVFGPPQFVSAQQVQPNQTVVMTGITQSATVTGVSTASAISFDTVNSNTSIEVTASNTPGIPLSAFNGVSIPTAQGTATWGLSDSAGCTNGVCSFSNGTSDLVLIGIQNSNIQWNYQTFGVWDRDLTNNTFQLGAFSAGAPSPASGIPTVSTATFTGLAMGFFIDASGNPFFTSANMTAATDFVARSIAFSTTNTSLTNLNTAAQTSDAGLNLSGTFSYSAGTNLFSGSLATANSNLTGTGTGRFYGPTAQEIGGTYRLQAVSGVSSMVGSFGGSRP